MSTGSVGLPPDLAQKASLHSKGGTCPSGPRNRLWLNHQPLFSLHSQKPRPTLVFPLQRAFEFPFPAGVMDTNSERSSPSSGTRATGPPTGPVPTMRTVLRNLASSTGLIHAVRALRRALARLTRRLGWNRDPRNQWRSGLPREIRYWRGYLESRGGNWPEEFAARLDQSGSMLAPFIARHLPPDQRRSRILDVGSGPLSTLGYPLAPDGRTIDLVATDVLATHYRELLKEFELMPASVPIAVGVEDLSSRFGEGEFDLVHMRNALDHCADPLLGIWQMIHVVRPGGYVLLQHYPNEADHANYTGLHCWNIDEQGGRFYLSRPPEVIDVGARLAGAAELRAWRDDSWIYCAIRRLAGDAIRMA